MEESRDQKVPIVVKKGRGWNLQYNDFSYSKDKRARNGTQYWRCVTRTCPGRLHTKGDGVLQVIFIKEHNHAPDAQETAQAKLKSDLCRLAAENPTQTLSQVYLAYITSDALDAGEHFVVPSLFSCKSAMSRARRNTVSAPPVPRNPEEATVQGEWEMMKAAQLTQAGGPENLYVGEVPIPTPQEGEVLIKVRATAINRADTLQRKGLYPVPPGVTEILGLEASGEIAELGPGCTGSWFIGDRVMALLAGGGNAEYVTCPEGQLIRIPPNLDFIQAAAIPEVWITAFQLLHTIGKVQSGETVLIHGGASGVGTAAIQLCVQAGARPIVTAGTAAKLATTKELGAVAGFNYKEEDVAAEVLNATNGKGVNIVLDCVGGSMYETNVNALAVDGRWIVYGLMGGANVNGDLLRKVLAKRLNIIGTTLRSRSLEYKRELVADFSNLATPLLENGTFKPIIHTVLTLGEIRKAHELMESNINTGKIILTLEENITVKQEL